MQARVRLAIHTQMVFRGPTQARWVRLAILLDWLGRMQNVDLGR